MGKDKVGGYATAVVVAEGSVVEAVVVMALPWTGADEGGMGMPLSRLK